MTREQKDAIRKLSPWIMTVLIPLVVWAFKSYDATNVSASVYRTDRDALESRHVTDTLRLHYEFREIRTRLDKLCTAVKC
jgi:hypothetical protein